MGRSGVGSPGLDQRAIRVGARQAPGAVEHGQGPIRLFMDPHRDRHLMEPGGILRDLQGRPLLPHRMVLGHDPLLGHTQNLGEVRADPGEEGGARFRGPHQKPGMMLRENVLGQRPAGRRQLRNPVPRQRCGPSVLHGAGPLRQPKLVDGAARLLGGPVVRTPVGREGTDAPRVTIRRAASTGTARAEARPIRRSCNPSAPSA